MLYNNLIFTDDSTDNWFYKKYYYGGGNFRYPTFQLVLNLLFQRHDKPNIIETGCQRELNDIGAGMSTSVFAEYIYKYGGTLTSVDNCEEHLRRAKGFMEPWSDKEVSITLVLSDSVTFLQNTSIACDLLYLDSLDYPIGSEANDIQKQNAAQTHCLNEFLAIENKLKENTIVLIDDNMLPGGGKPKILKQYLCTKGWVCLMDFSQSLWIKKI